ncbi:MAG TPA: hypothetical protein DC047_06695 [Blastocatellia bacterium]|nr:hypothetical protein [Blastocatellia bacterium]
MLRMLRSATYIFIDGSYLLRQHLDVTSKWFGAHKQLDLRLAIRGLINANTSDYWIPDTSTPHVERTITAFYYDCLVDEKKLNQTSEDHEKQVEQQSRRLEELREVDDCHIRLGSLKGPKRKQKEVDVLIAVDMMAHAARGNMDKAILVTGDLDLRPAVEALVQLGVSVKIVAYDKTTSTELTWAASAYRRLGFEDLYGWTVAQTRAEFPLPRKKDFLPIVNGMKHLKEGSMNGERCTLYESGEGYIVDFSRSKAIPSLSGHSFGHEFLDRLELYFLLAYQEIRWDS